MASDKYYMPKRKREQTYDGQDIVFGQTYYYDVGNQIHICTPTPMVDVYKKYVAEVFEENGLMRVRLIVQQPAVRDNAIITNVFEPKDIHSTKKSVLMARINHHQSAIDGIERAIEVLASEPNNKS